MDGMAGGSRNIRDKRNEVATTLRTRIVSGQLGPGDRLPTRREIQDIFSVSLTTAQAALESLARDQFVISRGTLGTFVVDNPPHLAHYGVVTPSDPSAHPQSQKFHRAIQEAVSAHPVPPGGRISIYWGAGRRGGAHRGYETLLRDVERERLAGLIFTFSPVDFLNTPILDKANLPRVSILSTSQPMVVPGCVLRPDYESWFARALEFMRDRGRKRLGFVANALCDDLFPESRFEQARDLGFETQPAWTQFVQPDFPLGVRNACAAMLQGATGHRPDAVIIVDDNLLEPAVEGLVLSGALPGDDYDLLTHCNFPWPKLPAPPTTRLGFHVPRIVESAIEMITRLRRGEQVPRSIDIPAVFEDEIADLP